MSHAPRRALSVVLMLATVLVAVTVRADEAGEVAALLRDLESADFTKSHAAAETLAERPRCRSQIVPALVAALRTTEWPRCGGDMRDAIARTLVELNAREAVVPLLELAASGKPIDHECVE